MTDKPRLARHVTVGTTTYGPNDDVPDHIREQITNPQAWVPLDDTAQQQPAPRVQAGTTGGHRLASHVAVGATTYGPDDHIPDDVAAQITNPKAWQDGKLPNLTRQVQSPAPTPADGDDKARKTAPPTKRA
jgi:hypothetical protein